MCIYGEEFKRGKIQLREKTDSSKKRLYMLGLSEVPESVCEVREGVDLVGVVGLGNFKPSL